MSTPETERKIKINILVNSFVLRRKENKQIYTEYLPLIEQNEVEGIDLNGLINNALLKHNLDP